ncbi:hypothetical protein EB796_017626 [Bugula neritina]|uniref:Fe-S hydro-lyase tartrate dehydratase beta-type catalytic domain-containing protein n=1 Tax=Bugula neritina TaxID=10212 RepID=A0A7J7JEL4_BUGNE|nr:hypothetical protein EB796_017626 [Bugula neritina]
MGVSCSADRQAIGKITSEGVFIEQLEKNPGKYLPEVTSESLSSDVVEFIMLGQQKRLRVMLVGLSGQRQQAAGYLCRRVPGCRGSMVMLAKGNRSKAVTKACKTHGGFYLGSIGGPAAVLAQTVLRSGGMEAVWKIKVKQFPAFIVVDDKGNDFFKNWQME